MNLDPTVLSYSFDPGSDSTKYVIETAFDDARGERRTCTVARRYSMFLELHASIAPQLALPHKLPAKKKLLNTEKVKKQRVDRLQDYLCRAVAAAGPRPPRALALFLGVPEMTEAQLAESVVAEDARFFDSADAAADASWRRGVSIEFLVAFTNAHGCWDARTDEVVRDVIRPATAAARCRYVDLPAVAAAAAVGPAATFVCHCWGAQWGTLVAALADGAADRSRRVWIDVFAVRQWPGNGADLDFRGVIGRSAATLVAVAPVEGALTGGFMGNPDDREAFVASAEYTEGAAKVLAFCRLWCLSLIHI